MCIGDTRCVLQCFYSRRGGTEAETDAANALNASATIFEAMAEVDSKFAKYADKECDSVSAEVKKWFKKLAVSYRRLMATPASL